MLEGRCPSRNVLTVISLLAVTFLKLLYFQLYVEEESFSAKLLEKRMLFNTLGTSESGIVQLLHSSYLNFVQELLKHPAIKIKSVIRCCEKEP